MHKLNKKGRKKLTHLSDLDIANQSTLQPIKDIAASVGISEDALEPYGHYKAKINIIKLRQENKRGSCFSNCDEPNTSW